MRDRLTYDPYLAASKVGSHYKSMFLRIVALFCNLLEIEKPCIENGVRLEGQIVNVKGGMVTWAKIAF